VSVQRRPEHSTGRFRLDRSKRWNRRVFSSQLPTSLLAMISIENYIYELIFNIAFHVLTVICFLFEFEFVRHH